MAYTLVLSISPAPPLPLGISGIYTFHGHFSGLEARNIGFLNRLAFSTLHFDPFRLCGGYPWLSARVSSAILNGAVIALGLWALPRDIDAPLNRPSFVSLGRDIDWVGALIISMSLALLSLVLAVASGLDATTKLRQPLYIVILSIEAALLPAFVLWMRHQTRRGHPALIPNTMWSNLPFTSICLTVFLVWGTLNASEQLATLYFQDIRGLSTLTAAFYFRPSFIVPAGCTISGLAPLLLAILCRVEGPGYWQGIFQAMALNPIGADLIYTIADLVTTAAFPNNMQALAGDVFNTLAQIGKSVRIATSAVLVQRVADRAGDGDDAMASHALLLAYRAGWWYNCALGFTSIGVSFFRLRKISRLEDKRD
ncbi:uncharacterized protein KD926_004688 [Aspergillus affinis]|uniref:uncharacterized protein n=1 Tax=Aspergillus affinis TaxID=1070780 RepID=UPI0022FDCE10|nr:uncharacterized protein KD926_004688 [Aspergillus affinis]KAI9035049.1 hypothetical protein KD926_004688 [Aspergillus affinis]